MPLKLGRADRVHRDALDRLVKERAVDRIWAEDATLWKTGAEHRRTIESALGWLNVAERLEPTIPELEAFVTESLPGTDRVVVLGMGGSSLAPLVFASSFKRRSGYPEVEVLDSTHPTMVLDTAARSDPARTLYIVSSKSGTTLEPNILFDYFYDLAEKALPGRAGSRFVIVTDPGSALEQEGHRRGVSRTFPGDPRIGGRYSALSNFGLVPAAFVGVDLRELLRRARDMAGKCRREAPGNPGALLGGAMAALAMQGRDKLTFSVGRPVDRFGMWAEQLIAESTGKEEKGIVPVEGEELGAPEVYGDDRFFVRLETARGAGAMKELLGKLAAAGHPLADFELADALDLGSEMFRWEFATAIAGALLGINPFDQPNVQEAKDRTNEILEGKSEAELPEPGLDEGKLAAHLGAVRAGDYFAITAYVPSTAENEEQLSRLRLTVRDSKKVATTVGFGPRFLHSTGQLHKGGGDNGVFLQITDTPPRDVPVPGRPWSFGRVIEAQAAGDLAALVSRGRRVLSVRLPAEPGAGIEDLTAAVSRTVSAGKEQA